MTFELLKKIIEKNNIPENVTFLQDSGWECGATEMNGVWYSKKKNEIQFTQKGKHFYTYDGKCKESYDKPNDACCLDSNNDWVLLYYDDDEGHKSDEYLT